MVLLNAGNSNCHNSGYYCTDFGVAAAVVVAAVVEMVLDVVVVVVRGVFFYCVREDAF